MNFTAFILALAMGSAAAFVPSTRVAQPVVRLDAEQQGRREFGAAAAAALAGVGFTQAAKAQSGAGAKFSFFGANKNQAASMSEGAAYGLDQSAGNYSPYSPFSKPSEKSLYRTVDNTDFFKKMLNDCEARFPNYQGYIEKKQWNEITTESTRKLYDFRRSMTELAVTEDAKKATAKVFLDLNALTYACRVKKQEAAQTAYDSLIVDYSAYKKAVGM